MVCTYDIESTSINKNGLVDKIHCIAIKCDDEKTQMYTSHYMENSAGSIAKGIELLRKADLCVGLNNVGFDKPVIDDLYGVLKTKQLDLLILSQLMYSKDLLYEIDIGIEEMPSNLKGMYSLAAWGYRLSDYKGEFNDWSKLSSEMMVYGIQDVDLTYKLYKYLKTQEHYPSDKVIDLEHDIAYIVQKQSLKGWFFDKEKADELHRKMAFDKFTLEKKLQKAFAPKFLKKGKEKLAVGTNRYKYLVNASYVNAWAPLVPFANPLEKFKNGKFKFKKRTWFDKPMRKVTTFSKGAYQPIEYTIFKPSSRKHIEIWLRDKYGWEPTHFTPKGNPKVDADTLGNLDYPETDDLKTYLKLNKDYSQLISGESSILKNYDPVDNCIRHRCNTLGTNTFRMSHSSINISQIPSQKEFRELFIAPN